uniref:NADH-ubiquinone oxidoreductase chain 6 n=1 Tax=Pneumocystis oryctolagi TaxID=42067 RepID=A0A8A6W3X5_9ASCO|nr:NADH dehydrogenase subunit 6 [Pneumocystis oryctolagi]QTK22311.1 NADH dehydrogenase subunit 6 [Pneumocystis oryctolagi]
MMDIHSGSTSPTFLLLLSLLGIVLGMGVITSSNPVISLLYLIGLFVDIAIYLMTLHLTYLGLSYITVYVGAIAMLFIFVIMMLNIQVLEKSSRFSFSNFFLGLILGLLFISLIFERIPSELQSLYNYFNFFPIVNRIYKVSWDSWEENLGSPTVLESLGKILYTHYSLFLIIISLVFLLTLVGALCIARSSSTPSYPSSEEELNK